MVEAQHKEIADKLREQKGLISIQSAEPANSCAGWEPDVVLCRCGCRDGCAVEMSSEMNNKWRSIGCRRGRL